MASRKTKKFELDDFGFSKDLDMPDFSFETPPTKDDRNPVTKVAKAALRGAKDTAVSPSFIRKVIRDALPRGYGSAMDLADETTGSLKNLYNTAAKEIKPALNELKRTTARAMPQASKVLPKSVANRLKKWASTDEKSFQGMSVEQQREAALMMQLGDVFKYQAETNARQEAEGFVKDKIKEGMEQSRHRDQLGQLNEMRISLAQMAQYQSKIDAGFQRKSLELQYRHYFVAMDLLEETKRQNAVSTTTLEAIAKNTGLPDFVKQRGTERMKELLRNRFLESINDGVFDKRRNFVRNLGSRAAQMVKDKVGGFAGNLRMGLDMANQSMDMQEMMKGMGPQRSGAETAAGFAGGFAADFAGGKASKYIASKLAKNRKVARWGNKLQQGVETLPQKAGEWARSSKGETGNFLLDSILNFGKDVVASELRGPDRQLNIDGVGNLQEQALYSRHANKSITEIIPGFLARIYQELQIMRTGNAKTELTTYDLSANKFTSKSAADKNAFNSLFGGFGRQQTQDQVNGLVDKLDPNGTLTPEQRKELGKQMLADNLNQRTGDKARLTKAGTWRGQHGEKFAQLFRDHLAGDSSGAKELDLTRNFGNLGSGMNDARANIQNQANAGMLEFLTTSGVVDPATGQIDMERVYAYYYGDEEYDPQAQGAGGNVHSMKAARSRKKRKSSGRPPVYAPSALMSAQQGTGAREEQQQLMQALKDISAQNGNYQRSAAESLLRIEQQLAMGLVTYSANDEGIGSGQGRIAALRKHIQQTGRGWNMTLKEAGGKVLGGAGWLAGQANKLVSGVLGSATGALGAVGGLAFKGGRHVVDKVRGIRDVYIPGEVIPRLTMWKMKAGQYRDQTTGKVIKTFKDISGNVIDEAGNVVMTVEEAKTAFIKMGVVKKTIGALTSISKKAFEIGGKIGGALLGGYKPLVDLAVGTGKAALGLLSLPQDVYVKGNPEPVLLARIMRTGGYFSQRTGRVIKHPGMIDGPVIDEKGDVVLTASDLKGGVLNKMGKPIRTGFAKLAAMTAGLVGKGIGLAVGAAKWIGNQAKSILGGATDFLAGISMPDGLLFSGSKTMVERLTEIRDLLDSRLPKSKRVAGDIDGDGVREGSYEDLMRKKKAATANPAQASNDPEGKKGGLGAGLMALLGKLRGNQEEDDDGDTFINAGGGDSNGKKGKAPKKPVPKGFWNKTKHFGKVAAKAGLGAAKWAGSLALGLGGLSLTGLGGSLAGMAGAIGGGAAALGSGALAVGGTILGGIAALLASPVVLGALAVAAVGAAGYYGYKALTKKRLTPLSTVRYAQYGFDAKDEDHLQTVFGLEDRLEKAVTWSDKGPKIDDKKVDIKEMLKEFGVDEKKTRDVDRFLRWFGLRFKPVYLTHLAALKAVAPGKSLSSVEDLKPDEKKRYFALAKFSEGPYDYTDNPFGGKQLPMNGSMVAQVIDNCDAELAKLKDETPGGDSKSGLSAGAKGAATAGAVAAVAASNVTPASLPGKVDVGGITKTGLTAGAAGGITMTASFEGWAQSSTGKLDALAAIRYKAYGLTDMVVEKTRALDMLERAVQKQIKYDGKNVASFSGAAAELLVSSGGAFGAQAPWTPTGQAWMEWFVQRFLPVYLNYCTALRSATGKDSPETALVGLKANAKVDVATAIYTTPNIWAQDISPWPGYGLNTDSSSVEANFQALKEAAKKSTLDQEVGTSSPSGMGKDNGTGNVDGAPKGFLNKAWDAAKNAAGKAWEGAKSAASAVGTGLTAAGSAAVGAARAAGSAVASGASAIGTGISKAATAVKEGVVGAVNAAGNAAAVLKVGIGAGMGVKELANFMGQQAHESGNFKVMQEGLNYKSAQRIKEVFGKNKALSQLSPEQLNGLVNNPEALANVVYGGRMGNTAPGDGYKYRGRGFIQLTGKANYEAAGKAIGVDLVNNPDLAGTPEVAAKIGLWYWQNRVSSKGGGEDVVKATKLIQGADGGLAHRQKLVAEWEAKIRKGEGEIGGAGATSGVQTADVSGPAAGAMPASGGGGGVVPVSDVSPGAAPAAAAAKPTASQIEASANAGLPPKSVDPAVAAAGSGFQPVATSPRAADLNAQSQAQRDSMSQILGSVDKTMQASLGIQSQQLDVLKIIAELIKGGARVGGGGVAPSDSSSTPESSRRPMASPPVSMQKTT